MRITIEEAIGRILEHTPVMEEEFAPLLECVGRVLTRSVVSPIVQPPFDRSPLDGYAVIAADIREASKEVPAVLRVVDTLYAGQVSHVPVLPGQAVRVMTGSMLPKGADCVVRQEDTDMGRETVQVRVPGRPGGNCCRRGEEYGLGDVLLFAGQSIDAAAVAVAAGAGIAALPVPRRPRAAVISTGDEVLGPEQPLLPGKIYNSNSDYLAARLGQLGVSVTAAEHTGDSVEGILAALERCSAQADILLTSGGVSVGEKDLLEEAALRFGAEVIFHGISMKPGMPTLFAAKGSCLLLALSGNPFSAAVPFELLIHPMLAKMSQDEALNLRRGRARTANAFHKHSPCRRFLRACCQNGTVFLPGEQSNGQMRSMMGCNCLVDVPPGGGPVNAGETVDIVWI